MFNYLLDVASPLLVRQSQKSKAEPLRENGPAALNVEHRLKKTLIMS